MSLQTNRISDLDNKGADLEATDLFYISVPDISSPTGYVTKGLTGQQIFNAVSGGAGLGKNFAQTQWNKLIPAPVSIPDGSTLNIFTEFDNVTDKVANGTTSYNEYDISNSILLTFTGIGGEGYVTVNGVDYNTAFNTSEDNTAFLWWKDYDLSPQPNVTAYYNGDNTVTLVGDPVILSAVTYTQTDVDLNVAISSLKTSILIPYLSQPYENQRLVHTMRVGFRISAGSSQSLQMELRRSTDDTIVNTATKLTRDVDATDQTYNVLTYTSNGTDPFVTGGFYIAIKNDSGVTIDLESELDFLIITQYQENVVFP